MEIKDIYGKVIHTCDCQSIKDCVEDAVKNRVYLRDTNLRGADLRDTNLRGADLSGADLSGADLCGAVLNRADLRGAYLSGADLRGADLRGAYLRGADLCGAYLCGAYLRGAYLRGADLRDTNLRGAYLGGAKNVPFVPMNLPEGEFIGYKKVDDKIIKLKILEDSKRSRATTDKCRCDRALVLAIQELGGEKSELTEIINNNYKPITYKVGEIVYADAWDEDRWNECSHGIHFFLDRESAVRY